MKGKDCMCEIHVKEEARDISKKWIKCLGHDGQCPCGQKEEKKDGTY